jgi:hypothetical protein
MTSAWGMEGLRSGRIMSECLPNWRKLLHLIKHPLPLKHHLILLPMQQSSTLEPLYKTFWYRGPTCHLCWAQSPFWHMRIRIASVSVNVATSHRIQRSIVQSTQKSRAHTFLSHEFFSPSIQLHYILDFGTSAISEHWPAELAMILWLTQFWVVQHQCLRICVAPKIDVLSQHPWGFF